MKNIGVDVPTMLMGLVLGVCLIGSATQCMNDDSVYTDYCQRIKTSFPDTLAWHLAIYMDIHTCLTCCEDMKSWQELEATIPQYDGMMSIWAPQADSLDVAEAMRLEGITTPIRVLDQDIVERLNKTKLVRPIVALFDSTCRPALVREALPSAKARVFNQQMLDTLRSRR
jgi:hypothetical protein